VEAAFDPEMGAYAPHTHGSHVPGHAHDGALGHDDRIEDGPGP
jgi:hypothetical protein